jgi:hypothetical protein
MFKSLVFNPYIGTGSTLAEIETELPKRYWIGTSRKRKLAV